MVRRIFRGAAVLRRFVYPGAIRVHIHHASEQRRREQELRDGDARARHAQTEADVELRQKRQSREHGQVPARPLDAKVDLQPQLLQEEDPHLRQHLHAARCVDEIHASIHVVRELGLDVALRDILRVRFQIRRRAVG